MLRTRSRLVLASLAAAVAFGLAAPRVRADTVHLEGGGVVKGTIVEETNDVVKVKLATGAIQTIPRDSIQKIEKEASARAEYEKRLADVKDRKSADDWAKLGAWAKTKSLHDEARACFEAAVALEKNHEAAREGLGQRKWKGEWVPVEDWEHLSKGQVRWNDEWVTPEDKDKLDSGYVKSPKDGMWIRPEELQKQLAEEEAKRQAAETPPAPSPAEPKKEAAPTPAKPEKEKPDEAPRPRSGKSSGPFRVITFNMRFDFPDDAKTGNNWAKRADLVAEAIKASKAQICCAQEDKREQVNDLKTRLTEFDSYGKGRNANFSGEACTIWWQKSHWTQVEAGDIWLSDTPDVPGSNTWGCKYPHKATWVLLAQTLGQKKVLFMSTHYDEHKDKNEVRKKSAKVERDFVTKKFGGKMPFVLCGDYNAGPDEDPHDVLVSGGWCHDSWDLAKPDDPSPGTVHDFKGTKNRRRIDWIMVAPGMSALQAFVHRWSKNDKWPSDHYPVVAELEVH